MSETEVKTLEEILEEYKGLVKIKAGIYFMFGGDKDDLMQEGMIGLVKAYNSFDESKGASFQTYASVCVERAIINAVKAANRKKDQVLNSAVSASETYFSGEVSDPESNAIFSDYFNEITTNRSKLFSPLEHRVVLNLLEGKSYTEIAAALGKTPKSIDNAISRIRVKLRKLYEN